MKKLTVTILFALLLPACGGAPFSEELIASPTKAG